MAMRRRFVLCVALATCLVSLCGQDDVLAQDAYIGQMDGSSVRRPVGGASPSGIEGAAGVYIHQVPPNARPLPPRPQGARRPRAAQVGKRTAKRLLPDVGAGVTLAVPASAQDYLFPSVRKGTVGG